MRSLKAVILLAFVGGALSLTAPAGASTPAPYSWGSFADGASDVVATPTAISGVPGRITQIVAANSASYALTSTGQVWDWGADHFGQLGDGTKSPGITTTPVQVDFPAGVTIASLPSPMPAGTAMAIDTNGNAWGWGSNNDAQLCLGNTETHTTPVQLPFTNVTAATGAGDHASYVSNGNLYSCGGNENGQLGDGNTSPSLTPVAVDLPGVVSLYSSWQNTAALLQSGEFYIWGINNLGQLGDGSRVSSDVPVQVVTHSAVVQASVGGNTSGDGQTIVQLTDGAVKAWGADKSGQLCDGRSKRAVLTPHALHLSMTLSSFASSGNTSYLLDTSGNLWACGDNHKGEIGDGTTGAPVITPTMVLSGVSAVSATSDNAAALK